MNTTACSPPSAPPSATSGTGRHPHPYGKAHTLDTLAGIDHDTGHLDAAVHRYRRAATPFRDRGHTVAAADSLDRLGRSHAAAGQRDQALAVWREALELYRSQQRDTDADRVRRQLDALAHRTTGTRTATSFNTIA